MDSLPQSISDVAARLQNLRNLLSNDRLNAQHRRAMDALDREMAEMAGEPYSARFDRRRRGLESVIREYDSIGSGSGPETLHNTPSLSRTRRRTSQVRRMQRRRDQQMARARQEAEHSRPPFSYVELPRMVSPDVAAREYSEEAQVNREYRWRAKRRKLDHDAPTLSMGAFKYGYMGQVVPGKLRLHIASCDGGQYSDTSGENSWASNVLEDDTTVYCTKNNRCNIVLGHAGNTPFSLTKIVIKAPRMGFDSPIQEGMVFVAMNDDNLLSRTASYQIQYTSKRHRQSHPRPDTGRFRLAPSHEYFSSTRSPLRSIDRSALLVDPTEPQNSSSPPRQHPEDDDPRPSVLSSSQPAANPISTPSVVAGFRVTMNFEDSEDDETTPRYTNLGYSTPNIHDFDQADIDRLLAFQDHYSPDYHHRQASDENIDESSDSDSSDNEELLQVLRSRDPSYHRLTAAEQRIANENYMREFREWRRSYRRMPSDAWWSTGGMDPRHLRSAPSRIVMAPSNGMRPSSSSAEPGDAAPDEILPPHARFFIRRDKSSVAIKFDPPVYVF